MSGVPLDGSQAAVGLIEFVELLRNGYGYRGYLHVKVPPGAAQGQVETLMRLVDRVSFQLDPYCQKALAPELPLAIGRERGFPLYDKRDKHLGAGKGARFPRRSKPVPEMPPVSPRPYQPYLLEVPRASTG
jgi:hypothetical protein